MKFVALVALAVCALNPFKGKAITAASAFVDAPAMVFPTIDSLTRLDMLDYFNSGSVKPSKNAFKGDCKILSLSPAQIDVQTSAVSDVAISLVKQKNDTILLVITTCKTPAEDSSVHFFSRDWKPIEKGLFIVPQLDAWLTDKVKSDKSGREDAENICPFTLARCTFDPSSGILTLTNNIGHIVSSDKTGWVSEALKDSLKYRWNGKRMVPVKD